MAKNKKSKPSIRTLLKRCDFNGKNTLYSFHDQQVQKIQALNLKVNKKDRPKAKKLAKGALYHELYAINLSLTLTWLYAKASGDTELTTIIQQNLSLLSKHALLKDKCFILAKDSPQLALLFKTFDQLIKSKKQTDTLISAAELQQLIKNYLVASGKETSTDAGHDTDTNIPTAGTSDAAERNIEISVENVPIVDEDLNGFEDINDKIKKQQQAQQLILKKVVNQIIYDPWESTRYKMLMPKRLRIIGTSWGEVNLTDALLGFYKLGLHKALYQQLKANYETNKEASPLDINNTFFDMLFTLYESEQNKPVKNKTTLKALKKSLNNAAEYFNYNYRLTKNVKGDYEKLPALGRKANAWILEKLGLPISNKIIRRTTKEVFNYAAWGISLTVALGVAAMAYVAIIAIPGIGIPLAILLTLAAFATNLVLFKGSIYKALVRFFIKKDLVTNLTSNQKMILAAISICCFFSAVALGALTFTSMFTLVTALAIFPPAIPIIIAAVIMVATVLATTALLFTAACDLVKNNFYLAELKKYFSDAWNDCVNATTFNQQVAAIFKLVVLPLIAVLVITAIVATTASIGSALWSASGALITQITAIVKSIPLLYQAFTAFGPLLVSACTIGTVVMEGLFNTTNFVEYGLKIADLVKTTIFKTLDFIENKVIPFILNPKRELNSLKKYIPTLTRIGNAVDDVVENPYVFLNEVTPVAQAIGATVVIANAVTNGAIFTGTSKIERSSPAIIMAEIASNTAGSIFCNLEPMNKLISGGASESESSQAKNKYGLFNQKLSETEKRQDTKFVTPKAFETLPEVPIYFQP